MGWVLLLRSMARTVELVRAAHEARGEALQAARLAQLVTVELRQVQARLEAEAALVGAQGTERASRRAGGRALDARGAAGHVRAGAWAPMKKGAAW